MPLHPLTLGPIIRHNTTTSIRLWGKSNKDFPYLVARIYETGYFHHTIVNSDTNFTGTVTLTYLHACSLRKYQMAMTDSNFSCTEGWLSEADWENIPVYTFSLDSDNASLSFILGSCRFFLPIFCYTLFGNSGDKIFNSINKQLETKPVDFVAMIGDQIYADTTISVLDKFLRAKSFSDFDDRYQRAFSYPHIKRLLACNPTYMIGDDHEYRDNYDMNVANWELSVYRNAMNTFNFYQYVNGPHSPNNGRYWFNTIRKGIPFFWMDVRNERNQQQIISITQLEALKAWLLQYKDEVKCLVTAVPMFLCKEDPDNWQNYKGQLREILDLITINSVKGLIILTGDAHMAVSSQYSILGGSLKITELMSSGFCSILHDSENNVAEKHIIGPYVVKSQHTSNVITVDLFSRVEISARTVKFSVYDKKGVLVNETLYNV